MTDGHVRDGTTLVLEATGLAVGRGDVAVLSGVELAVRAGEQVALAGANGSGKTTLLRVLAGLDRPLAGVVRWLGGPLLAGPARPRTVGVLFQGEAAPAFLVRELVALGLALDGPPGAGDRRRVAAALEQAALEPVASRPCRTLSGGELQRAALARATVAGAPLLLLDEPTNHLDPARQAALLAWLERRRGEVAVVLASHDLGLVARCDRVLLLGEGRVLADGPPAGVLTPAHLATALGVEVRRLDDPAGGPPLLRVVAPAPRRSPHA